MFSNAGFSRKSLRQKKVQKITCRGKKIPGSFKKNLIMRV